MTAIAWSFSATTSACGYGPATAGGCRSACARQTWPRLLARRVDGIFVSDFEQGEIGPDLFRHACLMGLEGLVSKHRESVYRGGRFDRWVKVKNRQHPAFRRFRMRSVCEERSRPPGVGLWAARSQLLRQDRPQLLHCGGKGSKMATTDRQGRTVETPTEARQAEPGPSVLALLAAFDRAGGPDPRHSFGSYSLRT